MTSIEALETPDLPLLDWPPYTIHLAGKPAALYTPLTLPHCSLSLGQVQSVAIMNILITGGSGLIGRALCRKLTRRDDRITVFSRQGRKAQALCGERTRIISSLDEWESDMRFDAVVNLAGEPIVGKRWSARRKQRLSASRVTLTQRLIARMARAEDKPAVLLNASAVGYYGNTGDAEINETHPGQTAGTPGFGTRLCRDWEESARQAEEPDVRVCLLRTGLVLSPTGGMLRRMLPAFRLGLGATIGDGKQWMSWIHIKDQVNAILHLLDNPKSRGAYNLTAPTPVTNAVFTRTLAKQLRRPAVFTAPALALKLMLGEAAGLLLEGQRAVPDKLCKEGFRFAYASLPEALRDLCG